jgi:hypothetical protein
MAELVGQIDKLTADTSTARPGAPGEHARLRRELLDARRGVSEERLLNRYVTPPDPAYRSRTNRAAHVVRNALIAQPGWVAALVEDLHRSGTLPNLTAAEVASMVATAAVTRDGGSRDDTPHLGPDDNIRRAAEQGLQQS